MYYSRGEGIVCMLNLSINQSDCIVLLSDVLPVWDGILIVGIFFHIVVLINSSATVQCFAVRLLQCRQEVNTLGEIG